MQTGKPADIEAEVRFLTTAEGGRNGPVKTDYRPDHAMGLGEILNGARHAFPGREWLQLGESVLSSMWFTVPEYQFDRLFVGMDFTIQEGAKIVGRGRIVNVLNDAMRSAGS